jgi:hypothetical protein
MEQYKFQKLDVYKLALAYVDVVYVLSKKLPQGERFNLARLSVLQQPLC